ncbi:CHASE domain-containing protein [Propionivibrio sp.]|uniref:CHASE domain-containing protein n=1 Tax=Propionivibrio sp. TaxID=2212460 RepID=UPI003BF23C17
MNPAPSGLPAAKWLRVSQLLPWLVLVVGLAVTYLIQQVALTAANLVLQDQFAYQMREISLRIEQRLVAYQQVLLGARGLFSASESIEREEFREYVRNLQLAKHYPGIQGVGFSLIVLPQEKAGHIAAIRQQGFPEYSMRPEGERDLYTAIIYLEPFADRNLRAFGYDMYSEAVRRVAMEAARDLGSAAISGKVTLVQEAGQQVQAGFLMYVPVFRNGQPNQTLAERRAGIIGWVYAPFRLNDLMQGILGEQGDSIHLEIFDGKSATPETLMFNNRVEESVLPGASPPIFQAIQPLEIFGQAWTIRFASLPAFEAGIDTERVTVIRLSGLLISVLLAALVRLLVNARERAISLASIAIERSVAAEKLRDSEERFRNLFDKNSSVMLLIDPDSGQIVDANSAAAAYYGYPKGQMDGMLISDINILPPEQQIAEERQRAVHEERNYFHFPHRLASGELRQVEVHSTPIQSDGRVLLFSIVHDITERKRIEGELLETKAILQAAMDQSPAGIAIAEAPSGTLRYVNEAGLLIRGGSRASVVNGVDVNKYVESWQLLDLDGRPLRIDEVPLARAVMFGETSSREFIVRRNDDDDRIVLGNAAPIRNDKDEVEAAIVVFLDITDRKQAEEALASREALLKQILDTSSVAIFLVDRQGRITQANQRMAEMFGCSLDALVGHEYIALVHPAERETGRQKFLALLSSEIPSVDVDRLYWRADQSEFWGHLTGKRFHDAGGEELGLIGVIADISDRKQAEELIKKRIVALTQPLTDGAIAFEDLFRLDEIQRIQHEFAAATGVASIITQPDGTPITAPSNFTQLCGEIIRKTELGCANCYRSDAAIGRFHPDGPIVQQCMSGGLWDAGVSITVGGHHIANWLIGQVRDETQTDENMRAYAQSIGADESSLMEAFRAVPSMSRARFELIAKALFSLANQLSTNAFQNVQQARFITERKQAEEQLQLAASVFTHAREGIMITNADGTIIDANNAFTYITSYGRDEVLGHNPRMLGSGRQNSEFYAAMLRDLTEKGHWYGEVWNQRKSGEMYAVMQNISAVRDADGHTRQYVALLSDITALKEHEQQLEHLAHYDSLTALPNRVLLADRLRQALFHAQRRGQVVAVAYLDLDGFKAINDRHGHEAGDQLLMTVANRMKQALREGDTLARMGGDEFVAVLVDLADVASSVPMINRLLAAAAQPVSTGNLMLQVSASLGVTFYPQAEDIDADQLLRQADQAMYQAKLAGRNRYHVFDAELDRSVRGHHESLERIRSALCASEFVLHYQPKVNLRSGAIIGAEALIRWQHPENGLLLPAEFLPVIEDHPLAVDIGEWVIATALTQMAIWQASGLNIPVSVNVGARQLQQANFVERLRALLAAHPEVSPGDLELEVLETSALEDLARVSEVIESCREIGVMFALDDFGTGYSSLTYLKRLAVNQLKIDQSFVRDMLDDPDDLAILEGVLSLASAFRRQVIAEGVETVEHGEMLLQLGCELAQGYGIARPMPAHELPAWAAAWHPDPLWADMPAIRHDDLPLHFASAELRAWIGAIASYLKGDRETRPPTQQHSRFGLWLATEGQACHGAQPAFQCIEPLHRQIHALAEALCELKERNRDQEALARLPELLRLRDSLLELLKALVLEKRPQE